MGNRKRIGLLFAFDESWTGGVYYLYNIILAFKSLHSTRMPELIIFYRDPSVIKGIAELDYPFISYKPLNPKGLLRRIFWKVIRKLAGPAYHFQYSSTIVDFVFPVTSTSFNRVSSIKKLRKVYWIPDFQEKYLPHFFSTDQIKKRYSKNEAIAKADGLLVLSSADSLRDFVETYPDHRVKPTVLHFASVLPDIKDVDPGMLREKYKVTSAYFVSPNQFWAHKNHKVVLEAALLLKQKGVRFKVFFTGREYDYRNPGYTESLKEFVEQNDLHDCISFLGFIDRREQLKLMQNGIAVIQPSLFEGWSTVVEDSKALGANLLLSRIRVHEEQCGSNAQYFDPADPQELASLMTQALTREKDTVDWSYADQIKRYAESLLKL